MQIHLVLPGLVWPAAQAANPAAALPLPALSTLLGHAAVRTDPAAPFERRLGSAFGLAAERPPLAALRRLGEEGEPPPAGEWLCADPVQLYFAREHLLLADAAELDISADESAALIAALNDTFADLGRFEAGAPERWYLRLTAPSRARFFPINDVVGRAVAHFLPEGEDAALWQRTMNEAQIVLHNHPVNRAREAAGRRTVNSVWLWGAGALPQQLRSPYTAVQATTPLARGLARAGGVEPTAPQPGTALGQDTLVVLEDLLRPALHLDLDAWRAALIALERDWFAPLQAAFRSGRLDRLHISAPGDRTNLELSVGASQRWKFWRRPCSLDDLLKRLPAPARPQIPTPQP